MNTQEARRRMRDLAAQAITITTRLGSGEAATKDHAEQLRAMVVEARGLLAEAGYPAEAVWRGLQRADIGIQTALGGSDAGYWLDVSDDLTSGMQVLENLVGSHTTRDVDFRIVT